ncbi:7-deoxyloganetin glucosyltransferase-like [Hordeum vulgare subsp. vulgare]|uniref:7-deoxyloganetin glucosyltransferase-like n=1 Tax=Hordeum vulgare subsp. vulgare TaxID=112509 RepID=UPI001D1A4B1F|nr:7-deoxyloganetin glucosyltransferase-like [Hordeum vulgare subsp. vulgare]
MRRLEPRLVTGERLRRGFRVGRVDRHRRRPRRGPRGHPHYLAPAVVSGGNYGEKTNVYPFLWNVRPDLVKGDAAVLLPEFQAAIKGCGLLMTWCPHEVVIENEAVGVFLTHSGWNLTLESLCTGVPMLSWPFSAEQQTNCWYKRTEWAVGMEIGGEVRRAEVAAMIRETMQGEKGEEMRHYAAEWKQKAARATL